MKTKHIIGYAFLHALLTVFYIAGVATIMTGLEDVFGPRSGILGPIVFLSLFVVSAAVVGMLIFFRPLLWYLESRKKEAIQLAVSTVAFLALISTGIVIALLSGVI